jgi:hypothetical protein
MKFFLVIVIALFMLGGACKLEMSSATPNSNVNASPTVDLSSAPPQETGSTCSLKMAGAPSIIGLRLGMTADEVLALFPGSKEDAEVRAEFARPQSQFRESDFVIKPAKYDKEKFANLNQIIFNVLDGKVSSYDLRYNGPQWPHVDKFVENLSSQSGLPPADQWTPFVGMDNQLKTLRCTDFEVEVFAGGKGGNLNYVKVKDLLAEKKLNERRAKAAAQATPTP